VLDGLVASIFFILLFGLLLHRLLWPIVQRPVYALASLGIVRRKKLSLFVGGALLVAGGIPSSVIHFMSKLLEGFVGS
jgi:hypothetical protein